MRPALSLLTWNVGRLYLGARINRWLGLDSRASDHDLPRIAKLIVGTGADVVAMQELEGASQLERLAGLLGDGWQASVPPAGGHDRCVGLLARARLEPRFSTVNLAGRPAGAVSLFTVGEAGGTERWAIASLHLDAFDDIARAAQAREALAWAADRPEGAVVVAGDLNLDVSHPARREGDAATYGALSTALVDLGVAAGSTALLGRRVDYVLGGAGVAGRVEVLRGRRVPLGDHHPLLARLTFVRVPTRRERGCR